MVIMFFIMKISRNIHWKVIQNNASRWHLLMDELKKHAGVHEAKEGKEVR